VIAVFRVSCQVSLASLSADTQHIYGNQQIALQAANKPNSMHHARPTYEHLQQSHDYSSERLQWARLFTVNVSEADNGAGF
jgi:hypothetical protein